MSVQTMTGLEKVAVLLKSLPGELVDKVMVHLPPKQAGLIAAEMEKLKTDAGLGGKLTAVLEEASGILSAPSTEKVEKPKPPASSVDIRVEDKPDEPPMPDPQTDPMKALASLPAELLALALDSENARTIALLINRIDIEVAGELYKRLSPAKRKEVSLRFTEQPIINEELMKRIAQGVVLKCRALRQSTTPDSTEPGGREKRVAALLRGLERAERAEMLTVLEQSDAELTGRVKALLYQFEDVLRMENPSVQKLLSEVDVKSLSQALRGAPTEVEIKILANLSKRAQSSLKEETELNGNLPSAKVKQARQTIVDAIQRLDERGDLVFIES